MSWFFNWWGALDFVQQVLACVALPATVILVLQTVLLLFGLGESGGHGFDGHDLHTGDSDSDANGHMNAHDTEGVRLFTVRGLVAFFAVGGWMGIAMIDLNVAAPLALFISFASGFAALLLLAYLFKLSLQLQDSGNLDLNNAIGKTAEVYLTVPANSTGRGKVTLNLQERFTELDATTRSPFPLKVGSLVHVDGLAGENLLLVSPAAAPLEYSSDSEQASEQMKKTN